MTISIHSPVMFARSPPRPSPGGLHYSDEDICNKYNGAVLTEGLGLNEKPLEMSESEVRVCLCLVESCPVTAHIHSQDQRLWNPIPTPALCCCRYLSASISICLHHKFSQCLFRQLQQTLRFGSVFFCDENWCLHYSGSKWEISNLPGISWQLQWEPSIQVSKHPSLQEPSAWDAFRLCSPRKVVVCQHYSFDSTLSCVSHLL